MWFFLRKFLYEITVGKKYLSPLSPGGTLRMIPECEYQQLLAENKKLRKDQCQT